MKGSRNMSIVQYSYQLSDEEGCLYIVPTPIGNLEDMTFRALNVLKEVNYIACEDTRQTQKLLNHFEINKKLVSYHDHNKMSKGSTIIEDMKKGVRVALVSDAGMPAISDPGEELVEEAIAEDIKVIALPGPNAALTALVASGLPTSHFLFFGFLDRHPKKRVEQLEELKYIPYTLVFYESPHRLQKTLQNVQQVFGERNVSIVKELSKKFEQYVRGPITEVIQWAEETPIKGEFCLIVEGHENDGAFTTHMKKEGQVPWWESLTVIDHVNHYVEEGLTSKESIKKVAKERNVPKRDVYNTFHQNS